MIVTAAVITDSVMSSKFLRNTLYIGVQVGIRRSLCFLVMFYIVHLRILLYSQWVHCLSLRVKIEKSTFVKTVYIAYSLQDGTITYMMIPILFLSFSSKYASTPLSLGTKRKRPRLFLAWPLLAKRKANVVIPKKQPLSKYLRKKRVKVRSTTCHYATKKTR